MIGLVELMLLFEEIDWHGERLAEPNDAGDEPSDPTEDGCGEYMYG